MATSRYSFSRKYKDSTGKQITTNSKVGPIIYRAVNNNSINYTTHILESGERLDTLAGQYYGDSSYWWVLAAASGIGWGLQVPPGTIIRIPINIAEVLGVII
jgi:nucleoid-associated protein YgaU